MASAKVVETSTRAPDTPQAFEMVVPLKMVVSPTKNPVIFKRMEVPQMDKTRMLLVLLAVTTHVVLLMDFGTALTVDLIQTCL